MKLPETVLNIQWKPLSRSEIMVLYKSQTAGMVDIKKEKLFPIDYAGITSVKWHPRNPRIVIVGQKNGTVILLDFEQNNELIVYDRLRADQ